MQDGHCLLTLYSRHSMPKAQEIHNLGPGRPTWLDWDCEGTSLAIMQEGVGIYLWDVQKEGPAGAGQKPTQPLRLAPSITKDTSFCMWSRKFLQLAIGTMAGKVIIFNKPQGVMQLHDRKGKHGAAVTCGDWLSDNRLGLASGTRVKISKPLAEEAAQWESYSKFKLNGMLSRVPRKFKDAGAPKLLSFSLSYPPFVAVCIGENVRCPTLPTLCPSQPPQPLPCPAARNACPLSAARAACAGAARSTCLSSARPAPTATRTSG